MRDISRTCPPILVAAALLALASCVSTTEPPDQAWLWERPCPQTYEFGNLGCARIVVLASFADAAWPDTMRIQVRVPDSLRIHGDVEGHVGGPVQRVLRLQLTDYEGIQRRAASDSLELIAVVDERVLRSYINTPLPPTLATVRRSVAPRFARVGQRPPVDTVRLEFRRE